MKRILISAMAAGAMATSLLTVPVHAQQQRRRSPEEIFAQLDTSGDKKLSLEEYTARAKNDEAKQKMTARFKKLDADNDGFLTLDEFKAGSGRRR